MPPVLTGPPAPTGPRGRGGPDGPGGLVARETAPGDTARAGGTEVLLSLSRARDVLGLDYDEFDVAVQTGEVRTVACGPCLWKVPPQEVARLRTEEGHPQPLLERVRMVSSVEAARRLGIGRERFVRLAKAGHIRPVRWYVNRYRALVWMYLAQDLPALAERSPALLHGPLPEGLREAVAQGEDERARSWRARRVAQLIRDAYDPWDEAAVWAALLGPEVVDAALPDPYERAHLRKLRTALPPGRTGSATPEQVRGITTADHPDEIALALLSLADALARARALRPAPRPPALPDLPGPLGAAAAWATSADAPLGRVAAVRSAPSGTSTGLERLAGGPAPLPVPVSEGVRPQAVGDAGPLDGLTPPLARPGNWLGGPADAPSAASALRPVPTGLGTVVPERGTAVPGAPGGPPSGVDPVPTGLGRVVPGWGTPAGAPGRLPHGADPVSKVAAGPDPVVGTEMPAAQGGWPAPRRGLLRLLPRATRRGSGRARSAYPRRPGRAAAAPSHSSPTSVSRMTARPSSSEAARSTSAEMPQP